MGGGGPCVSPGPQSSRCRDGMRCARDILEEVLVRGKGKELEKAGEPPDSDAGLTSLKERQKKGRQVLDFSSIKAPRNGPALVCLLHSVIGLGAASARLDLGSHAAVGSSVQQLGSWLCSLQEEIREMCFHGLPDHSVLPLGQTNGS